jgi:hypothetical protein
LRASANRKGRCVATPAIPMAAIQGDESVNSGFSSPFRPSFSMF